MAYNETINSMNSNLESRAAANKSSAQSAGIGIGLNALSNISDIVARLDEDKANDLIDEANGKMTGYIVNSQDEYLYDKEGRIVDDPEKLMEGLYSKAEEISNQYSGRYRSRINDSLRNTISSRSDSIYSTYANTLLAERKNSINTLINNELSTFSSGNYGYIATDKYNELVEYSQNHPEDKEIASIIDSISSKIDINDSQNDIYAEISYGLFIKKCNVNGMSTTERERIYGEEVKKSIYQQSSLSGYMYDGNVGFKAQVIDGSMSSDQWISNAIEHDRKFGYVIDGETYYYSEDELSSRKQRYQTMANEIGAKYYAMFDDILQSRLQEFSSMDITEKRSFVVNLGSPEKYLEWLMRPEEINGEEVIVNRRYAMSSSVFTSYYQTFYDAQVSNELFTYIEDLQNTIGKDEKTRESMISDIEYAVSKKGPEVQVFFNDIAKKLGSSDEKLAAVTRESLFAMYHPEAIGSNIVIGNKLAYEMEAISAESQRAAQYESLYVTDASVAYDNYMKSEDEGEKTIWFNKYITLSSDAISDENTKNYMNAMLDISSLFYKNKGSYSTLIENEGAMIDEIGVKYNLKQSQIDYLKNTLSQDQLKIDYENENADSFMSLITWYYVEGIAKGYQFNPEEVSEKAEEFGINANDSGYQSFLKGVIEIDSERKSSLINEDRNLIIQKKYNATKSYTEMWNDEDFKNEITSGLDEISKRSVLNSLEAKAEEERIGKAEIEGVDKLTYWYYFGDDSSEKTYEQAVDKIKELGLDPYGTEIRSILKMIMNNESSSMKSQMKTISYNKVERSITDYYEKNGSYEGLTIDVINGFEGASDLTDAEISSIYTGIYEKASEERLRMIEESKVQEEKDALKQKEDNINNAKIELEKEIINSDINTYEDAVRVLVDAGASDIEAESYVLSNFPSLYKIKKADKYTEAVQHVIDYVNSSSEFNRNELDSWLNENGYNATARNEILSFADIINNGYDNKYSASEIAYGLLGDNNSITYIRNQKIYADNLDVVLLGNLLANSDKGSQIYAVAVNELQLRCENTLYEILDEHVYDGEKGAGLVYEYIRDNFDENASREDFYEGMDISGIVSKYMMNEVSGLYIDSYESFNDSSKDMKYDEKRSFSDVFQSDSKKYNDSINESIHRSNVDHGFERLTINDPEYLDYSEGGVKYNEILSKIMSAETLEKAQILLDEYDKYLPQKESEELNKAIKELNINSLLKINGVEGSYESFFSLIAGADKNYFDDFSSYIANHPDEYSNLKNAIIKYSNLKNENRSEAFDVIRNEFTDMYNRFASSIMKSNQPSGILGTVSGNYILGDVISGKIDQEKYSRYKDNGKLNTEFGSNVISAFSESLKSAAGGNLGEAALTRFKLIVNGDSARINTSSSEYINTLNGMIYDTNQKYENDEIETFSLAISIMASGYPLEIDTGRLSTDSEYLEELKSNVVLALRDINSNKTDGYYGEFSTVINAAAMLATEANTAREYKSMTTLFYDGMKYEGFDGKGNMVTKNGSIITPVYDYGGDLNSISVTYKDNKGNDITIDDVSIHSSKSSSQILKSLGIESGTAFTGNLDYEDKLVVFNRDEYALKGENSYFVIPYVETLNSFNYKGVEYKNQTLKYKKISYFEAEKLLDKNGNDLAVSVLKGIF